MASVFGIGNILPSMASITRPGANKGDILQGVLDLVFTDCALIMEHSGLLISEKLTSFIPLPLLGFSFQTPEELSILKYKYAEYPYLNKASVVNSFLKEVCPITVTGLRPIMRENPIVLNYLQNNLQIPFYIERYCDRGGTWALNTMWGYFSGLVLTGLEGVKVEGTENGGIGFKFSFEKIQFGAISTANENMASQISKLTGF